MNRILFDLLSTLLWGIVSISIILNAAHIIEEGGFTTLGLFIIPLGFLACLIDFIYNLKHKKYHQGGK
jgi:hypothetical protein